MKFDKHFPVPQLQPYIKYYVVSEHEQEAVYKVFPSTSLVMGFQYRGRLSTIRNEAEQTLSTAGISGISASYQVFKQSPAIGTILVYFSEIGFTHFAAHPANELFNLSLALEDLFDKERVAAVEEQLFEARTDKERIAVVEQFLLAQLNPRERDQLILAAVQLIYTTKGTIRIKELNKQLFISPAAFEKRFRKVVGVSPKKFASIVRFEAVMSQLGGVRSLTDICYENKYFDQAHFIKDFIKFSGTSPEKFRAATETNDFLQLKGN
jgi:AraC-like DNA-binding protein